MSERPHDVAVAGAGMTRASVLEADLLLGGDCDGAAVGAAVTVELCGHWEHEGACRWPHNNELDSGSRPARFRTLFVAYEAERPEVEERIEASLRAGEGWEVLAIRSRPVAEGERELAQRLLTGPRAARRP